jgi:23S rRNA (cytosine1962-C5)-methyltransferase
MINLPATPNIIQLNRDLIKHLKRGHRWIFADCFDPKIPVEDGLYELRYKNESIAFGIVQAETQLRFRVLCLSEDVSYKKLNQWAESQFDKAVALRKNFSSGITNSFRLVSGEGDGLPGLIVDVYADTAVIKHDHPIMEKFWVTELIAKKICENFSFITTVYLKRRNDDDEKGENIIGELRPEVIFKENNSLFATNIRDAAKTGFFLDQRDNRKLIGQFAKDKLVLNLFSYTAGFSIFAALGGAKEITSVDIAKAATAAAVRNFEINNIKTPHHAIHADAFKFIDEAIAAKKKWDLVITDPPSFAPNQKSLETATIAYTKVFSDSIRLVNQNGLFAASSCSSHITHEMFLEICRESFSKARKRGTVVYSGGQPFDHPYPLAMDELRYLKFMLFRVE